MKSKSITIQSIGTHIKIADFAKSVCFYQALGFTKVFEYGPDKTFQKDAKGNLISVPESYHGMTFSHGGCKLEIADGHRAVKPAVFKDKMKSSKISLMINVDSIAKVIESCKKVHIPLAVVPRHYYWGTLEVVIKDPDGVVLVFIAPYTKSEAENVHADEKWSTPPMK